MKFEIEVPDDYIANVLCSGIGSDIGHWYQSVDFTALPVPNGDKLMHCFYQPLVGGYILFVEDKRSSKKASKAHYLTKEKLIRGIQVILNKYPHHIGAVLGDQNKQDAITGDVLIQCSVFGDLVYG